MSIEIGIDLGGTKMAMVSSDRAIRLPTGRDFGPDDVLHAITHAWGRPDRIGMAIPGIVDESGTVVACDVLPKLTGWCIPHAFPNAQVVACNDVDAAREEETHDLPAGQTAAIVLVGTAVGASFVVHGEALRGASGWAGEFGYWPVVHAGARMRLDEAVGGDALARALQVSADELPHLLNERNPHALEAVHAAAQTLGTALAGVLNLFNPHLLVVGGGTFGLPGYEAATLEALRAWSLPEALASCTVRAPRAGAWSAAHGALRRARRASGTG